MSTGKILKQIRKRYHWTKEKMAEEIGIASSTYNQLENDKRPVSGNVLDKIRDSHIAKDSELHDLEGETAQRLVKDKLKIDLNLDKFSTPPELKPYKEWLSVNNKTRSQDGLPQTSAKLCYYLMRNLESLRDQFPGQENIKSLLAKVYVERIDARLEISPADEVEEKTQYEMSCLKRLEGVFDDDSEYKDMVSIFPGTIFYVAGKMWNSIEELKKLPPLLTSSHPKASCSRDIPVAFGIISVQGKMEISEATSNFLKYEEKALRVADESNVDADGKAKIFCGLALGRNILDIRKDQEELLNTAKHWSSVANMMGIERSITTGQIDRTEALIHIRNPDADPQEIESQIHKWRRNIIASGYVRFDEEIKRNLLLHPNSKIQELGKSLYN